MSEYKDWEGIDCSKYKKSRVQMKKVGFKLCTPDCPYFQKKQRKEVFGIEDD